LLWDAAGRAQKWVAQALPRIGSLAELVAEVWTPVEASLARWAVPVLVEWQSE
jgi:hypothetical protein